MKLSLQDLVLFADLWHALRLRPKQAALLMSREYRRVNSEARRAPVPRKRGKRPRLKS